jgi:predicted TIM-barrel fold metal-dependent hydrolase
MPRHIAIIMDGNGRWAKNRGLPRTAGHVSGADTFRDIATYCKELGMDYLTVYAFSTENWKRPKEEVDAIMESAPDLNIILAHPGEPAGAKPRFEYLNKSPRLFIDISGTGPFRWNMIRYAVDCCGAEKIIFGSDMPTCSAGMFLYSVMTENLTEDERRLILAGNIKRLLGIK